MQWGGRPENHSPEIGRFLQLAMSISATGEAGWVFEYDSGDGMTAVERLEHEDVLAFHRQRSRVETIGWGIVYLVIVAACIGLIGNGPLSSTMTDAGSFRAQWDRFLHYEAPAELRFSLNRVAPSVALGVSEKYLRKFRIDAITPEPFKAEAADGELIYYFHVRAGQDDAFITFHLTPITAGIVKGNVRVDGGETLRLWHLIYP